MENTFKVSKASGFVNVGLSIAVLATMITLIVNRQIWALAIVPFWLLHLGGFLILQPNRAAVLLLFGAYKGTIKQNGFFFSRYKAYGLVIRNLRTQSMNGFIVPYFD